MLRIRRIEEKIANLYPSQEMRCPVHLSIGQEASAVGVCAALKKNDGVFSGHRSHAHYLAKGGNLKKMFAEIYGSPNGCSKGRGGSMHLIDKNIGFHGATPIVGSTIPIAVGAALTAKLKKKKDIIVIFFGDGATETGVFHESINFAVVQNLPIIFVCENNLYSVYSPLRVRQPSGRKISNLAKAHGIKSLRLNGNDVERIYDYACEAVNETRQSGRPLFFELLTYRWLEHCGPDYDNNIGYREESEFRRWKKNDPLRNLGRVFSDMQLATAEKKISIELEKAISYAKS